MEWKPIFYNNRKLNYIISDTGLVKNILTDEYKIPHEQDGYLYYQLYISSKPKIRKIISAHRLVATVFIPNPENKPEVNHIDGNKHNNCVDNLEWVTHEENIKHAVETGLIQNPSEFDARHNKYSSKIITKVINLLKVDSSNMSEISRITGVPVDTIFLIKTGRRYRLLSSKLNFEPIPAVRYDFEPYKNDIMNLIKLGYKNKDIRKAIKIPNVTENAYNYYIRKVKSEIS